MESSAEETQLWGFNLQNKVPPVSGLLPLLLGTKFREGTSIQRGDKEEARPTQPDRCPPWDVTILPHASSVCMDSWESQSHAHKYCMYHKRQTPPFFFLLHTVANFTSHFHSECAAKVAGSPSIIELTPPGMCPFLLIV